MPFDPLAFMKPNKAFSMEGLLSRDMFEKFAADDEALYQQTAFGENDDITEEYVAGYPDRWHFLAGCIIDKIDNLVTWLNRWDYLDITIYETYIDVYGMAELDCEPMYELTIDDGPRLSPDEMQHTLRLIRESLLNGITSITATPVERYTDVDFPAYTFKIMRPKRKK